MAPAPWEKVAPEDQLFVLVTGGNTGVGFGIAQRFIEHFIAERSLKAHLILITTTRGIKNAVETTIKLQQYVLRAATSKTIGSRVGPSYNQRSTIERIHLLNVQLDLCNFPSIYDAAEKLVNGTISSPIDIPGLQDVAIPRLDAIVLNAGIGGWSRPDWLRLPIQLFTEGIPQTTAYPNFNISPSGQMVDPLTGERSVADRRQAPDDNLVGYVFCANVFGHHILAHELLPLLRRDPSSAMHPGRIIWGSSVAGVSWNWLSFDDFQSVWSGWPYEGTKRLTDVLALTAPLTTVRPYSRSFVTAPKGDDKTVPPKIYLEHPGISCTVLMPLPIPILFFFYELLMTLSRLLGSPWHPVSPYNASFAAVWLAMRPQSELDDLKAERYKWGSSTSRFGYTTVAKRTEVEGWGYDGEIDGPVHESEVGYLSRDWGRKIGTVPATHDSIQKFETLGAECWDRMEKLRVFWDERVRLFRKTGKQ